MQYKENLFTFKFLFSWFFVNGKKIFKDPDPHTKCMTPYLFPKVDCDFMKMYFFAAGKNIYPLGFFHCLYGFSGEPNNSMGSENCLAMFGDDPDQEYYEAGTWNDENCDKELPFICQCPSAEGISTRQ